MTKLDHPPDSAENPLGGFRPKGLLFRHRCPARNGDVLQYADAIRSRCHWLLNTRVIEEINPKIKVLQRIADGSRDEKIISRAPCDFSWNSEKCLFFFTHPPYSDCEINQVSS